MKPRQLDDGKVAAVGGHLHHHQKTGEGHGEVSQGVEDRGGVAGWVHAEDTNERVARMGYGRIGQKSLKVFLNQRHQVPVSHGDDGERDEYMGQGRVAIAHGHQPGEHGHGRYLRGSGQKRRHLVRGSLIDAGRPDVEWKKGQLEEEAAQREQQPDKGHGRVEQAGQLQGQLADVRGLRRREERGQAEKHQGRGGDPAEEVLDPRLHLLAAATSHRDQGVERVAGQLQCDIHGQ